MGSHPDVTYWVFLRGMGQKGFSVSVCGHSPWIVSVFSLKIRFCQLHTVGRSSVAVLLTELFPPAKSGEGVSSPLQPPVCPSDLEQRDGKAHQKRVSSGLEERQGAVIS